MRFDANINFMFRERPLLERFAAAKKAGFSAVELLMDEGVAYNDLAAAARQAGVEVALCNVPMGDFINGGLGLSAVPGRQQQFRLAVEQVCEMASALNCSKVHIGPSRMSPEMEREKCFEALVENLCYAADRLLIDGVELLVETFNNCDTPDIYLHDIDDVLRAINEVGRRNVSLQLDIYHLTLMGKDILSLLRSHIDRIGHIQFADAPGRGEVGSGNIDFSTIFAEIDRLGYSGWIGAEYSPSGKTEDSLAWLKHYQKE